MNLPKLTSPGADRQTPVSASGLFRWTHPRFVCVVLVLATLAAFWPVLLSDFITLDDPANVAANPMVRQGVTVSGLTWALTAVRAGDWHPLAWVSHMLDMEAFGLNPAGHHAVNLLIHIANTILLFFVLRKITGAHGRSALVAALFALHPLHVESVAWISERKGLLSALFLLLSIRAYSQYAMALTRGGNESHTGPLAINLVRNSTQYRLALIFFIAGLMAGPGLVILPVLLLLLDFWPLGRIAFPNSPRTLLHLLKEKIPFFLVSAICIAIALAVNGSAPAPAAGSSAGVWVANTIVTCGQYLLKTFWPVNLAVPYVTPASWPVLQVTTAALAILLLSAAAVCCVRKLPFVFAGWFWFLAALLPSIGQPMADRHTYIALIGLFIALAWGAAELAALARIPVKAVATSAVLGTGLLMPMTFGQVMHWRSSATLFGHALAINDRNYLARDYLGFYVQNQGRYDDAIRQYEEALRVCPTDYVAYDNIGLCRFNQGLLDEAVANYQKALAINPGYAIAWNNLGTAYNVRGQYSDAVPCLKSAVRLKPDYAEARNNLGVALHRLGNTRDAAQQFIIALQCDPNDAETHNNFANLQAGTGKSASAIDHYRRALEINPNFTQALNNLGWVLAMQKKFPEAIECYDRALKIRPQDESLHRNFGRILAVSGKIGDAIAQYQEVLRLHPDDPQARQELQKLSTPNAPQPP